MKALILGNDPMQEYLDKGFNIEERKKYFNPAQVYEEVFYLSHDPKLPPFIREAVMYLKGLKIIKNNNVDVIRAYNGFRAGYIGALLKKKTKKPLIISLHDDYERLWNVIGLNGFLKKMLLKNERKALEACDQCIAVSNYIGNYAKLHGARNVTVIHNKLQLEQYLERPPFTILNIGRLEQSKNQLIIVEAVNQLRRAGYNLRLLIVGKGKLERQLKKELTSQDGLISRVPNTFLPIILKNVDLYINASFNEGFCVTLSEAQMCGLPIISSDIPGVKDIVNKKNALFFEPSDVAELKEQIMKVYNNTEVKEELSAASVRDSKRFDWNVLAEKEAEIVKGYETWKSQ